MRFEIIDSNTLTKVEDWANLLVQRIQIEMNNQGINASGRLSNSLEYTIEDNHIKVLADNYFLYAEKGRERGKVPYNFTAILEKWISDKGLAVPAKFRNTNQFAWAINTKIRKYGSDKYRNPSKRQNVVGAPLNELLPKLNEILTNRIVFYINDNLFDI